MSDLSRIGVAIESDLLRRFDGFIARKGYQSRSEAFRDLIRDCLVSAAIVAPDAFVVGTITLIYDHHARLLTGKLTDLQHSHHEIVVSTVHTHLDGDNCLEVIVVKGGSKEVRQLANLLISIKGVQHGQLVMSAPEPSLQAHFAHEGERGKQGAHGAHGAHEEEEHHSHQ